MSAVPEPFPKPSTVKRALSGHAAIGLLAGALLYLVCLTGTLSVFQAEWQRIEQPHAPEMTSISPQALQRAVVAVLSNRKDGSTARRLSIHLPAPDLPRTIITSDRQGVQVKTDGSLAGQEETAWSDFLVALHHSLNLPGKTGSMLVGALGVMILALSLSGILAHPRIFRDAFRLRARDKGGIGLADWHNRLSVWSLPFSVAIALTGAMIGLASVTAYALAGFYNAGDAKAVYAPLFGKEDKPDGTPGPVPNVAAALTYMRAHYPAASPTFIIVRDPGTQGQAIQVRAEHSRRLIFAEYYDFAADGTFRGTVGLADGKTGQQLTASAYKLHFGNYGGLPVKLAYLLFGGALTTICATGVHIWLGKRRRRGLEEPRLRKAWDAVVWGTPLALMLTLAVRFAFGNHSPFVLLFWSTLALAILAALAPVSPARFRRGLQALLIAAGGLTAAWAF